MLTGTRGVGRDGAAPHILVVDDDELVRETLHNVLSAAGYDVETVSDGPAAIEAAARRVPDLLLCDLKLPKMNGFEVVQELRSRPKTSELPFFLLSGLNDEQVKRAGLKLGAEDFLDKPIDIRFLKTRIEDRLKVVGATESKPLAASKPLPKDGYLVSLRPVIDWFGSGWPARRERALAIAESIVRRDLSGRESFTARGDEGFILVLPNVTKAMGEERIRRLGQSIIERLIGDEGQSAQCPEPSVGEAPPRAGIPEIPEWMARDITPMFRPIWDSLTETVVGNQLFPLRSTHYGIFEGDQVLHGGTNDPCAHLLSIYLLHVLERELRFGNLGDPDVSLTVPVHLAALTSETAPRLLAILDKLPQTTRARMTVELHGRADESDDRICLAAKKIIAFVPRVVTEILSERAGSRVVGEGVTACRLDLSHAIGGHGFREAAHLVREHALGLSDTGRVLHMDGVDRTEHLTLARAVGARLISGRVIGASRRVPKASYPLPVGHLKRA